MTHSYTDVMQRFDEVFDNEWENVMDRENDRRDMLKPELKAFILAEFHARDSYVREQVEDVVARIADVTMDLCENTEEFRSETLKNLDDLLTKLFPKENEV